MILLIRTDMSGTLIAEPLCIRDREDIPLPNSDYFSVKHERKYQHVVNHSYSADDSRPLFKGMVNAIYTVQED